MKGKMCICNGQVCILHFAFLVPLHQFQNSQHCKLILPSRKLPGPVQPAHFKDNIDGRRWQPLNKKQQPTKPEWWMIGVLPKKNDYTGIEVFHYAYWHSIQFSKTRTCITSNNKELSPNKLNQKKNNKRSKRELKFKGRFACIWPFILHWILFTFIQLLWLCYRLPVSAESILGISMASRQMICILYIPCIFLSYCILIIIVPILYSVLQPWIY